MSVFFLPRTRGNSVRVLATTAIVAVGIGAFASIGAGWAIAHADVHMLRIKSTSVVGPLSGASLAPAVRIQTPLP